MKTIIAAVLLLAATALPAQVLISDFTTLPGGGQFSGGIGSWRNAGVDQFTVSSGALTIGPVSGGNPDNSGYFAFADILSGNFDATGLTQLSVAARLDSGNIAPGFIINLYDSNGAGALTATFSAASFNAVSFTTGTAIMTAHPDGGSITDIQYFGIAGTGTVVPFRVSFDNASLTAIPEPGVTAALAGLLIFGFTWRRRRDTPV